MVFKNLLFIELVSNFDYTLIEHYKAFFEEKIE